MHSNTAHAIAAEGLPMQLAIEDTLHQVLRPHPMVLSSQDTPFSSHQGTPFSPCPLPVPLKYLHAHPPKYSVDLVLSGHVHAYERCCRSYKYRCTPDVTLMTLP